MSPKISLLPSIDVAQLGENWFLFDRSASDENTYPVPTQKISMSMAVTIKKIKVLASKNLFETVDDLLSCFPNDSDQRRIHGLMKAGYLETAPTENFESDPRNEFDEKIDADIFTSPHNVVVEIPDQLAHFDKVVMRQQIGCHENFFRLPNIDNWSEIDVGLVGVPISSVKLTSGSTLGPAALRQQSQSVGFWFDIFKHGLYSELGNEGADPHIICKDLVVRDSGDICHDSKTVADVFNSIGQYVDQLISQGQKRNIFIGGDHSITFPIVDSFLKHHPDMVIIHLDAHNDLHYSQTLDFNHAAPMNGLFYKSKLSSLHSFGVRTFAEPRTGNWNQFSRSGFGDMAHRYDINTTKRLINSENGLSNLLIDKIGSQRPCYLTIDLDVLSEHSISGAVSTPVTGGLEFAELLRFVSVTLSNLNVISADVVEYNPLSATHRLSEKSKDLASLLCHLIEGLGRAKNRKRDDHNSCESLTPLLGSTPSPKLTEKLVADRTEKFTQIVRSVPRISAKDLTYEIFLSDFVEPKIPFILTGLQNSDHLKFRLQDIVDEVSEYEMVRVLKFGEPNNFFTVSNSFMPAHAALRNILSMDSARDGATKERWSITDWHYVDAIPSLTNLFSRPIFFDSSINSELGFDECDLKWFYVGAEGTGTATHVDNFYSSAWLFLLQGKKQWRFLGNKIHSLDSQKSDIDLFNPSEALIDEITGKQVPFYEVEQQAGELIWTPSKLKHAVLNRTLSCGVTHNYIDHTNLPEFAEWSEQHGKQAREFPNLQDSIDLDSLKLIAKQKAASIDWKKPLKD